VDDEANLANMMLSKYESLYREDSRTASIQLASGVMLSLATSSAQERDRFMAIVSFFYQKMGKEIFEDRLDFSEFADQCCFDNISMS